MPGHAAAVLALGWWSREDKMSSVVFTNAASLELAQTTQDPIAEEKLRRLRS